MVMAAGGHGSSIMFKSYKASKATQVNGVEPQFVHDCQACIFVGITAYGRDVWICPSEIKNGRDYLTLRNSSEGPDYTCADYQLATKFSPESARWAQAISYCDALQVANYRFDMQPYSIEVLAESVNWEWEESIKYAEITPELVLFRDLYNNFLLRATLVNQSWELEVKGDLLFPLTGLQLQSFGAVKLIARAIAVENRCN